MKKITLIVALTGLLFSSNINAQDILFGVKAGFNVSSLGGASDRGYGSKPGFHAGVAAEIGFSDAILLQPEVLVSMQGSGFGITGLSDNINLFYLNIPLAVKYNIWDELYIEGGPQLGLMLGNNLDDFTLEANKIDFGVLVGAGYRLNDNFYFQLRFNAGLLNAIDKDSNAGQASKNRVFQVSAIYFL